MVPRNTAQIPPTAESTGSNQDTHMPHTADFTAGEGSRAIPSAQPRSRRSQLPLQQTPYGKTILEPIHSYGVMLNLDVLDIVNREELIEKWASFSKIAEEC